MLSLGVQSFNAAELRRLGRRHDAERALEAVRTCIQSGFPIVSVDLMFGLPGQTTSSWRANLDTVVELDPQHLSCYQLTIHAGTTFGRWRERGKTSRNARRQPSRLVRRYASNLGRRRLACL